jgi:hypothetical protein
LLIRVVGPALANAPFNVPGTMDDPMLSVFRTEPDGSSTLLFSQDNWSDHSEAAKTESTSQLLGAFALPTGSADAAFVLTLAPGAYTIVGSSADGVSSGIILVEVYLAP